MVLNAWTHENDHQVSEALIPRCTSASFAPGLSACARLEDIPEPSSAEAWCWRGASAPDRAKLRAVVNELQTESSRDCRHPALCVGGERWRRGSGIFQLNEGSALLKRRLEN